MKRGAGVLLHITSLPGKLGIGTFGKEGYDFVKFLEMAGIKYWQILPLGPTGEGDSPYQSFSSFAINPYLINLEMLEEMGLLQKEDYIDKDFGTDETKVDFQKINNEKMKVIRLAYENYIKEDQKELESFIWNHVSWIFDYALFMAAKEAFHYQPWNEWDESLKRREERALQFYGEKLNYEIRFHMFMQFMAYSQWISLKDFANEKGIEIIGDIPIYTAYDSADTWANAEIFDLDEELLMRNVSGCPPDAFSKSGQLWNNPVYRWDVLKQGGYRWWIERMRATLYLHNWVRIDHFRGFESFWSVPLKEKTAINGKWNQGPGIEFFHALKEIHGESKIIAEDLGMLTDEVKHLRLESGFPGMKVLQFAFNPGEESEYLPHHCIHHSVVYTGTHDNDTVKGWLDSCDEETFTYVKEYLRLTEEEGFHFGVIRGAFSSSAGLAIVPLQDFLGLDSGSRMNTPSTVGGINWKWRVKEGACTPALSEKIYKMAKLYSRI